MIIGVDGNEANTTKKVGVSVYTFELLSYFKKQANEHLKFVVYLRHPPNPELPAESDYFSYRIVKGTFLWSQIFFPLYLFIHKEVDVLFCPAHYAPRFTFLKTVVTIHDLAFFYYPDEFLKKDLYQLKNWTHYSLKHATKIIAVSKTTAKDIVKFYGYKNKTETVYNGLNKRHEGNSDEKTKEILKKKYILYVGTIQPRKNIEKLIEAFDRLQDQSLLLVIVGKKGWLFDSIYEKVKTLSSAERIIFTGFASDADVIDLYKHAELFILPSLYEGFGIPILEAMSFGCPVATSITSSLPEIGGDACLYFDPNSVEDIQEKIALLLKDTPLRNELVKKGKKRVQLFSWDICGEETLKVLKSVC